MTRQTNLYRISYSLSSNTVKFLCRHIQKPFNIRDPISLRRRCATRRFDGTRMTMIQVTHVYRPVLRRIVPFLVVATWKYGPNHSVFAYPVIRASKQRSVSSTSIHHVRVGQQNSREGDSRTSCHLFFRKTQTSSSQRRRNFDPDVFRDLQSAELSLPYDIVFDADTNDFCQDTLSIRFMTPKDIQHIMPICIEEFGTGTRMNFFDFPFSNLSRVSDWWDRVVFEPSVTLSLLSKMIANLERQATFQDPAILVLCRASVEKEEVVGMVEISLQTPDANRNPPPFPVPLWIKVLYCRLTSNRLQGWVTNLLIDPRYRGLGYAKILMAATEGVAKSWRCNSIYLHADADYRSGKVAQALYKGLGYEVVTDEITEYNWMSGGSPNPFSSIRMIEGVPLLCFRKRLQGTTDSIQ